jgi:IS5 family transposase
MADRGYDASSLRRDFKAVARRPIILGRRNRKRPI